MGKVSGKELNEGRVEFRNATNSLFEQLLAQGKRVPAQGKETLSESQILGSRITYKQNLIARINQLSPHFEKRAGKSVNTAKCFVNEFGEIVREEGLSV